MIVLVTISCLNTESDCFVRLAKGRKRLEANWWPAQCLFSPTLFHFLVNCSFSFTTSGLSLTLVSHHHQSAALTGLIFLVAPSATALHLDHHLIGLHYARYIIGGGIVCRFFPAAATDRCLVALGIIFISD